MILNKLPKSFVIALKDHEISRQQLDDCLRSCKKFNWDVEVFWGINGRSVTDQSWNDIKVTPLYYKPTMNKPGTWGCFFSHWYLWNECIKINQPIIILEHDAIIISPWVSITIDESLIKLHRNYKPKKIKYDNDSGVWTNSAHAYCLTPHHAETLINFVRTVGALPVDVLIGDKVLSFIHMDNPELVDRQNTYSTTGNL